VIFFRIKPHRYGGFKVQRRRWWMWNDFHIPGAYKVFGSKLAAFQSLEDYVALHQDKIKRVWIDICPEF